LSWGVGGSGVSLPTRTAFYLSKDELVGPWQSADSQKHSKFLSTYLIQTTVFGKARWGTILLCLIVLLLKNILTGVVGASIFGP